MTPPGPDVLPAELRGRVLRDASADPSPPRRIVRAVRVAITFSAVAAVVLSIASVWGSPAASRSPLALALGVFFPLMMAIGGTAVSSLRRRGMLSPPVRELRAVVVATPLVAVLGAVIASVVLDATRVPEGGHPSALLFAAPFAALLAWLWPSDPSRMAWQGAALGAVSGAWMSALVAVGCAASDLRHVLPHHLLFIPLGIGAGALLARRKR